MNNEVDMSEDKPELEKQPSRVIELNEWFRPFENYESQPYAVSSETVRQKHIPFQIANIGNFEIVLSWKQELIERTHQALEKGAPKTAFLSQLLILPSGEEKIHYGLNYSKQRQTESRLMKLYVFKKGKEEENKQTLPFRAEMELPSGNLVSQQLTYEYGTAEFINVWTDESSGEKFTTPVIPEAANILEKIQMRIVPIGEENAQ